MPWEACIPLAGSHQAPFPTPYLNNPSHAHHWHWTAHHQWKTFPLSSTFLSHLLIAGCDIGVQISVRPYVRSFVRPFVCPSTFTSKFSFLDIRDSCESETLHSNCPWHTLQARTLTRCPWPIFHGPHWLWKFLRRSLVFSPSEIAASLKPCIVIVLDIPFKHAP